VPTDRELVGPATVWALRLGVPGAPSESDLGPWAAEAQGDIGGAVAGWDDIGAPYEAALALAFSPHGQDQVAALRRLEALGATPVAAVIRRRMRASGLRSLPGPPRPSTRAHAAGLTQREHEVLEQLALGSTNEQIAQRLVISTRTAGHHVSAVLGKLRVANRRDAVVEADRLGLLPLGVREAPFS
jgi:DNA-binding CsgD family transcriptional regulator